MVALSGVAQRMLDLLHVTSAADQRCVLCDFARLLN